MKYLSMFLKLLVGSIVFMVTAMLFMIFTACYLPRLGGANYYENGCISGVIYSDGDSDSRQKAVDKCFEDSKKLREKGFINP